MAKSGIQGTPLEVTVVSCYNLDDKEWLSRQDPYVCVEYGSAKYRTKTCTDGGRNPTFQEKFVFTLIEGLQELNVMVWNSNTFKSDELIGSGRILLQKSLSQGYDDSSWSIQSKQGRHSGDIRLILHYSQAGQQQKTKLGASGSNYAAPPVAAYSAPAPYTVPGNYPGYPAASYAPSPYVAAPPPPAAYHPHPCPPAAYPPQPYHAAPQPYYPTGAPAAYPPPPAMGAYPPATGGYPPATGAYPPPQSAGIWPPPPY